MGNLLSVPDACPGPDGQLLYTWDHGDHHLELELFPDAPAEFFYENDTTGDVWEATYIVGKSVPAGAMDKLRILRSPWPTAS
jgi:hypothetical protein